MAASRLGTPWSVVLANYGVQLRDGLLADRIDCQAVRTVPGSANGVALITVAADGQNTIVVVAILWRTGRYQAFDQVLQAAQVLVCQLEVPMPTVGYVLGRGRELNKTVILNPAPAKWPVARALVRRDRTPGPQ